MKVKIKNRIYNAFILYALLMLSSCSEDQNTFEKLDDHLKQYKSAEKLLIERNYEEENPISRFGLEFYLGNLFFDKFSNEELEEVSEFHQKIISENALKAKRESSIDLSSFRNQDAKLKTFCRAIPKGGMLHVHPWGLFTKPIIEEILAKTDPLIEPKKLVNYIENKDPGSFLYDHEISMLNALPDSAHFTSYSDEQKNNFINMFILPSEPEAHDFERFDSIFSFVDLLLGNENRDEKLLIAYSEFLKNAQSEGVSYVEFTEYFSPNIENIEKLKNWANLFYEQTGIVVRWNIAFLRFDPAEENAWYLKEWNNLLLQNPSDEITGIDLLSLERGFPVLERAQDFYAFLNGFNQENTDHPLEMTMHAGELGDVRNVRDALLMGVSRIGHGVLLKEDPVTLEYARRIKLPVEINISSNHRLGVHNMNNSPHPFLDFLRLGLQVSLSTDNDAIFETDIANECVVAVKTTDIEYFELKEMSYNSVRSSFAKDSLKQDLLKKLDNQFVDFESKYSEFD